MRRRKVNDRDGLCKRSNRQLSREITYGYIIETGKSIKHVIHGKSRQELKSKLDTMDNPVHADLNSKEINMTLGEWLDKWFKEYFQRSVAEQTWKNSRQMINNHIKPILGDIPLYSLDTNQIQRFYNGLSDGGRLDGQGGLSYNTVRLNHFALKTALDKAVELHYIPFNPCHATNLPKRKVKEKHALSLNEQWELQKALEGERLRAAYMTLLGTGLRRGELLALYWENIDLDQRILYVRQSLDRVDNKDGTGTVLAFKDLKTKKSKRAIPLPDVVVEELRDHKVRQVEEKVSKGKAYEDLDLVFCTISGTPIEPRGFNRVLDRIAEKCGLNISPHIFRHTYCTRLSDNHANAREIAELAGHDVSVSLTTYIHPSMEKLRGEAEKINQSLIIPDGESLREHNEETNNQAEWEILMLNTNIPEFEDKNEELTGVNEILPNSNAQKSRDGGIFNKYHITWRINKKLIQQGAK